MATPDTRNTQEADNMTEDLKSYLDTHPYKGWKRKPRYFKYGDFLTYFTKQDRCTGKRIDEFLTIYTSIEDGSVVGYKIKGVMAD